MTGSTQATKKQKTTTAIIVGCLSAVIVGLPALAATATKPYFKTFGADVLSGGWFNSGTNCDTSTGSRYQDPNYSDSSSGFAADPRTGGILSYAKKDGAGNSTGGASSQYSAFALGIIEGSDPESYGFYSAGGQTASAPTLRNLLSFANEGSSASLWGGKFDGSSRHLSNCIPDYYAKLPSPAPPALSSLSSSTSSGTYTAAAGTGTNYTLNSSAVVLKKGAKITIYVDGNVYIGGDIIYELDKVDNVPKFALVAKGSIYIDPNVTKLDGFYIAQPEGNTVSADDGGIWTCHANNTNQLLYTDLGSCNRQLLVNGALVAKRVNFTRINGDVASASTSEDVLSGAIGNPKVAEVINYTPAMVTGGPFFNPLPPNGLPIDSLVALPPVF